jgi:ligand-binding sensor domain-containing protein
MICAFFSPHGLPSSSPSRRFQGAPLGAVAVMSRACLVAVLILLGPSAAALDPETSISDYAVRFWQTGDGLPQNNARTIIQTRDGYIWLGTKAGLARFDGVRFTVFDDRVPDQLLEGEVWALQEDDEAGLWVGTFGGGLSRYKDGRFTTFTTREGLPSDFVGALTAARDGGLWIGTDGDGLALLKDGRFTSYTTEDGLLHDRVTALYSDKGGTLWIGTGDGLSALCAGRFTNYPLDLEGERPISAIVGDGADGVWVGLLRQGLIHIAAGTVTHYTTSDGLVSDEIGGLYYDSRGTLWIATARGLCRRRADGFSCSSFQTNTESVVTIALRDLQAPWEDSEGNLWVGSVSQGLTRFKDSQFVAYGEPEELGRTRYVVLEARDGTMWYGGMGGLRHLAGDNVTGYDTKDGLPDFSIRTLFEDADGTLWIGTGAGLRVLRDGRIERETAAGLGKAYVYAVLRDRRGDLWVGTSDQGLFHGRDGHYRNYRSEDGLNGSSVRFLREDSHGDVWIGTKDGALTRWHEGRFTSYGRAQGLAGDSVNSLYIDRSDALWVATRHGLSRIKDGRVTSSTSSRAT